jgi:hypothetical protein
MHPTWERVRVREISLSAQIASGLRLFAMIMIWWVRLTTDQIVTHCT